MLELVALFAVAFGFVTGASRVVDDPYTAAVVAARLEGLDDVVYTSARGGMGGTAYLVAVGMTGSRLRDLRETNEHPYEGTAIHAVDAWLGARNYRRAVESGALRPETCPFHRDDGTPRGPGRRPYDDWSTRGPYEVMVHDKLRLLRPFDCFPIEWTDVPIVSAVIAARWVRDVCGRYGRDNRYDRRGRRRACDWRFLRCVWAGLRRCSDPAYEADLRRRFVRWIGRARALMRERGHLPPREGRPGAARPSRG